MCQTPHIFELGVVSVSFAFDQITKMGVHSVCSTNHVLCPISGNGDELLERDIDLFGFVEKETCKLLARGCMTQGIKSVSCSILSINTNRVVQDKRCSCPNNALSTASENYLHFSKQLSTYKSLSSCCFIASLLQER